MVFRSTLSAHTFSKNSEACYNCLLSTGNGIGWNGATKDDMGRSGMGIKASGGVGENGIGPSGMKRRNEKT